MITVIVTVMKIVMITVMITAMITVFVAIELCTIALLTIFAIDRVHMSSKEIVTTVEYKSWMDSFGTNTTHIFIGKGMNSNESSYFAATKYNNKLNTINSTLFPKLFLNRNSIDTNNSNCSNSTGNSSTRNSCTESIYVMGKPLLKYHMTPLRIHGLEYNSYDDNTIQKEVNEFSKELINRYQSALDDEINLVKLYSEALLQIDTPRNSSEELLTIAKTFRNSLIDEKLFSLLSNNRKKFEDFSEIKLKFLGTGCSLPSKYRNVSGILLSIPNYSRENRNNSLVNSESNSYDSNYVANYSILLDVGEGTWYQLVRLYLHTAINTNSHNDSDHSYNYSYENSFDNSYDNSNEMVTIEKILAQEIRIIWISHPHADHHLGLVTIIKRRKELCDRITFIPLLVIAPPSILAFLQDYCSKIDSTLTSCYVGLSTRQFDNNDDCIFSDNYWLPDYTGDDHFNTYSNTSTSNGNSKSYSYAQTSDRSGDNNGQSNPIKRRNWLVRGLIPESIRSKAAKDMEFGMKVLEEVGIVSISNTPVIHCPQSYGISIDIVKDTTVTISNSYSTIGDDHNSDAYNSKQVSMSSAYNIKFNNSNSYDEQNIFRVVYSGDTRPTYELVRIGMEADVLVHEATFENDMREEAVLKNHSTIAEAMEIGGQMNAKRIVLTHFSQRYPSMPTNFFHHDEESMVLSPKIINSCNSYDSNSGRDSGRDSVGSTVLNPVFAFDFMNLSMRDLLWAPTLTKALTMAFPPDTTEELETEGDL